MHAIGVSRIGDLVKSLSHIIGDGEGVDDVIRVFSGSLLNHDGQKSSAVVFGCLQTTHCGDCSDEMTKQTFCGVVLICRDVE